LRFHRLMPDTGIHPCGFMVFAHSRDDGIAAYSVRTTRYDIAHRKKARPRQ
jgi:hypothetical protein